MKNSTENFNPLVSIIIPVYNGEKYIKEAIESALNQTYKNIEVIVVNDGSEDETEKICLSYGQKIKYFVKNNGGVSTALNLAIKKMSGEYFSWLSHDDIYKPNKIEYQVNYLSKQNNKELILYHDYELIDSKGMDLYKVKMKHNDLIKYPYRSLCLGCINGITMLIPKTAFDNCGLFDSDLRVTQDYDMWKRIIEKYDFIHLTEIVTKTRLHSEQDTNTNPAVLTEGNKLWTSIVQSSKEVKILENFGSYISFYEEMYKFLMQTPYKITLAKVKKLLENELNKPLIKISNEKEFLRTKFITNSPLDLSIIIPAFNTGALIIETLDSIINSLEKNQEIIIINDASTDQTLQIIKDYQEKHKDKNIRIHENEKNIGCGANKALGVTLAKGKYIGFLDSDDFVDEEFHQRMLLKAKELNAEIVVSDIANLSPKGIEYDPLSNMNYSGRNLREGIIDSNFLLGHWSTGSACTKLFKKEFILNYEFQTTNCDDLTFTIPAISDANTIVYCKNNYYYYRHRTDSMSRIINVSNYIDGFDTIFKTIGILFENNQKDLIKQFVIISFLPYLYTTLNEATHEQQEILLNHVNILIKSMSFDIEEILKENKYIQIHDSMTGIMYNTIAYYILSNNINEYRIYTEEEKNKLSLKIKRYLGKCLKTHVPWLYDILKRNN